MLRPLPVSTLFPYTTLFRSLLAEERQQQMVGLDVLLVPSQGHALGLGERFLQLGGELLESHRIDPFGYFITAATRSEEHTSELQSLRHLVCRLLLEKQN